MLLIVRIHRIYFQAAEISQERICDDELIIIRDPKVRPLASFILRGPNDHYVDEIERSLHDALLVRCPSSCNTLYSNVLCKCGMSP